MYNIELKISPLLFLNIDASISTRWQRKHPLYTARRLTAIKGAGASNIQDVAKVSVSKLLALGRVQFDFPIVVVFSVVKTHDPFICLVERIAVPHSPYSRNPPFCPAPIRLPSFQPKLASVLLWASVDIALIWDWPFLLTACWSNKWRSFMSMSVFAKNAVKAAVEVAAATASAVVFP